MLGISLSVNIRTILIVSGVLAIGNAVFIATQDTYMLALASIIVLGTAMYSAVISRKIAIGFLVLSLVLLIIGNSYLNSPTLFLFP